ncbi:MAG: hypothetical protein WCT03_18175 [Candidatus Obscuribacterales bacterium]
MNGDTRLSEALKASPAILEYVISLNPHDFARLRNPLLNKVMPTRITLRRLANMVGLAESDFVAKINELAGLPGSAKEHDIITSGPQVSLPVSSVNAPDWMNDIDLDKIEWVDVTPIDAVLGDPMPPINIAVNTAKPGEVVAIKHMWEPQPLYDIWAARDFQFWAKQINDDLWHVFVFKPQSNK